MAELQSRRVPPLVWVIVALIAAVGVWMATHTDGMRRPPSGGPAMGEAQAGGGAPVMPRQPSVNYGPTAPPAPNGSGPTNMPGVLSQPAPNGAPS